MLSATDTTHSDPASRHCATEPLTPHYSPPAYIPALDGIRGLAICLILVFHFGGGSHSTHLWVQVLFQMKSVGWIGVDLFFVLSGFLITRILIHSRSSSGYYRSFYSKRALRIFPVYYAVLAGVAIVAASSAMPGSAKLWIPAAYATNLVLAFWPAHFPAFSFVHLEHFWSLAVEEHFYLFWPAAVRKMSRAGLVKLILAAIAGCGLLRIAFALSPLPAEVNYYSTFTRVDSILWGALGYLWWSEDRATRRRGLAMLMGGGACMMAVGAWRGGFSQLDPLVQTLGYPAVAVASLGLILAAVGTPSGGLEKIFNLGALRFMGKYSYGIYVFHHLLRPVFWPFVEPVALQPFLPSFEAAGVAAVFLSVAISVGVAVLSYELFEKHFLNLKRYVATT